MIKILIIYFLLIKIVNAIYSFGMEEYNIKLYKLRNNNAARNRFLNFYKY